MTRIRPPQAEPSGPWSRRTTQLRRRAALSRRDRRGSVRCPPGCRCSGRPRRCASSHLPRGARARYVDLDDSDARRSDPDLGALPAEGLRCHSQVAGPHPLRPAFARQAGGGALSRRRRRIRVDPGELQQHHERRAERAQRPRHQRDDPRHHEAPADRRETDLCGRILRRCRPRLDGRAQSEPSRRRDLDRWPPGARASGARPEVRALRGGRRGRLQLSTDARARRDRRQGRRAASPRVLPRPSRLVSCRRRLATPCAGWKFSRCATVALCAT